MFSPEQTGPRQTCRNQPGSNIRVYSVLKMQETDRHYKMLAPDLAFVGDLALGHAVVGPHSGPHEREALHSDRVALVAVVLDANVKVTVDCKTNIKQIDIDQYWVLQLTRTCILHKMS